MPLNAPSEAVNFSSRKPTLEQVAARAGVSRSTASRVINGGDRVSPHALEAVHQAIAELGFTPNRAARSLVTRRTDSVAMVIPESSYLADADPFVASLLTGLTARLDDHDIQVVVVMARPGQVDRTLRFLSGGHVDGAVVANYHRGGELITQLHRLPLPVVLLGKPPMPTPGIDVMDSDHSGGAQLATAHLVRSGRRHIAHLAGPADLAYAMDRVEGWRSVLTQAGLTADALIHADFTFAGAQEATEKLLDSYPGVDAIFAASDLMAAGVLSVLNQRGIRVPEDVAVVGYDDVALASTTSPPLTTIAQPIGQIAKAAGERLLDRIAGGVVNQPRVFGAELVVRASS